MPERIALVTGANGFLGRHCARALAADGYTVRGVGHGSWSRDEWRAWGLSDWHAADVTLEALLTFGGEPDVVFHCAGGASVAFSMAKPAQDFRRTVDSTLAVLELARLCNVPPRVVLLSTGSVYGSVGGAVSEGAPLDPRSPYAFHKVAAERLCREYGEFFGVASAIIRLFSVHGPGLRKQLLWDACNKLARGESSFAGTGREVRDWVYVDDAVDLLVRAAGKAARDAPVVNGGTGAGANVAEVLDVLAGAFGHGGGITFTGRLRPGDPEGFVADATCARSWGWSPRTGWAEGVRRYVEWFKAGAP